MKEWRWPFVAALAVVVTAIVVLFALADQPNLRQQLINYFDTIVPFVFGAAAGGAVGGATGYLRGLNKVR